MRHIKHIMKMKLQQIRKNCVTSSTEKHKYSLRPKEKLYLRAIREADRERLERLLLICSLFPRDGYFCWSSIVTCLPIQRTCMSSGKRALVGLWQWKQLHSSDHALCLHVCCFDLQMSAASREVLPTWLYVERVNTVQVDYQGKLLTVFTRACVIWSLSPGVWVNKTQCDHKQLKQWEWSFMWQERLSLNWMFYSCVVESVNTDRLLWVDVTHLG